MEQADGVRSAADGRDDRVRQLLAPRQHRDPRLAPDHRLEVAHHGRIGMRPRRRADQIIGVLDIGDPVAHRLVHGVLERRAARGHRHHLRPQQLHAEDVGRLPLDVGRAHVDDAFQAEAGADRRRRHAVLAGPGLGDDPRLAHPHGQQDLAHAVVDLVRARVIQLVALEPDVGRPVVLGQPLGQIQRAGPADIVGQEAVQLGLEARVRLGRLIGRVQLVNQRHQGLGHEPPAIGAEAALGVGHVVLVGDDGVHGR
jgi:hypothetical protein